MSGVLNLETILKLIVDHVYPLFFLFNLTIPLKHTFDINLLYVFYI